MSELITEIKADTVMLCQEILLTPPSDQVTAISIRSPSELSFAFYYYWSSSVWRCKVDHILISAENFNLRTKKFPIYCHLVKQGQESGTEDVIQLVTAEAPAGF